MCYPRSAAFIRVRPRPFVLFAAQTLYPGSALTYPNMIRTTILCALAGAFLWAQDPIAPHSAYEPPAARAAQWLTASTKASRREGVANSCERILYGR